MQELDRVQGRGLQGAKSPLLWEDEQVQEYLAGSPLIGEIKERLKVWPHHSWPDLLPVESFNIGNCLSWEELAVVRPPTSRAHAQYSLSCKDLICQAMSTVPDKK